MPHQIIEIINERFRSGEEITNEFLEECNKQLQQELFALPINTYEVANLDGWKLYSSDSLKRKFIESMYKISRSNPIAKDVEKMVGKSKIIPCWINKGLFGLLLFKAFAPKGTQGILGFYYPKEDQIYLLIDNNISFGFASNTRLSNLMIHESIHMSASHMKNNFIILFTPEFTAYYTAMVEFIFKTDGEINKEVTTLFNFLFKNFEFKNVKNLKPFFEIYHKLMFDLFRNKSKLGTEEFDKTLLDFMNFIRLYFRDINGFISSLRNYTHIYRGLLSGYEKGLKVRNTTSLCIQELFFPSEIICIYSELCGKGQMSKIYRAFRSI